MARQLLGTMSWERARQLAFVRFVGIVMKVGPATVSRWNWVKIKIAVPTDWSEKSARIWCNGMRMRRQPRFVQRSMELSSTCTTWQMKTEVLNTRAQGCWWEAMDQRGSARGAQIGDQEKNRSHTLQPVLKREVYTTTYHLSSVFYIFIGPRSDHSLPMSVTHSLTDDLVKDWMNWPECADFADYVHYSDFAEYA